MSEIISIELGGFYQYSRSERDGKALRGTGRVKGWHYLEMETEEGGRYPISTMDVWVRCNSGGNRSNVFTSSKKDEEYVQLNCYVDGSLFDELKDPPAKNITIDFELKDDPSSIVKTSFGKLLLSKFNSEVVALNFHIQEYRAIGRENSPTTVSKEMLAFYAAAENSQINGIADELLCSYEEQALQDPELRSNPQRYQGQIENIIDLLREAVQRNPQEHLVLSGSLNAFREYAKTLDQTAANRLSIAFDTIWKHQDSAPLISAGVSATSVL